jgi:hypothetical protein
MAVLQILIAFFMAEEVVKFIFVFNIEHPDESGNRPVAF